MDISSLLNTTHSPVPSDLLSHHHHLSCPVLSVISFIHQTCVPPLFMVFPLIFFVVSCFLFYGPDFVAKIAHSLTFEGGLEFSENRCECDSDKTQRLTFVCWLWVFRLCSMHQIVVIIVGVVATKTRTPRCISTVWSSRQQALSRPRSYV